MYRSVKKHFDIFKPETHTHNVSYNAKIKLHGTNAGILFTSNGPVAQGRTRLLSVESDNFGFAQWVEVVIKPAWEMLNPYAKHFLEGHVVHGEWAGPGIQKNAGCSMIEQKSFFIFSIEDSLYPDSYTRSYIIEPNEISDNLEELFKYIDERSKNRIHILPWFFENDFDIDLFNIKNVEDFLNLVNPLIEEIGDVDPYIKDKFGIEGPGEGLVFYDRLSYSEHYIFKAKCEAHRTTKSAKAVNVNTEKMSENAEFAQSLVTDARLSQGYDVVSENGTIPLTMKEVSSFLKWVAGDVQKECLAEMEDNGKDWKTIAKYVNNIAVSYFQKRIQTEVLELSI
jgi:hypothetical protein